MQGTIDDAEQFLEQHSKLLHPNHYHMTTCKHNLMQVSSRLLWKVLNVVCFADVRPDRGLPDPGHGRGAACQEEGAVLGAPGGVEDDRPGYDPTQHLCCLSPL